MENNKVNNSKATQSHEPLADYNFTINVNDDFFKDYIPPVTGRFNCAGNFIWEDPAHVAFPGHDLNHK